MGDDGDSRTQVSSCDEDVKGALQFMSANSELMIIHFVLHDKMAGLSLKIFN